MGAPQSVPQSTKADRDARTRDRSVSLVNRLKERSASFEASRNDYVVGLGHYILRPNCRVEAYDTWRSSRTGEPVFRWRPGRIRKLRDDTVLVAFDGFSERWDTWLPLREGKIRSPTGGPVVGPGGSFYPPMETVEPMPADEGAVVQVVAAPIQAPYSPSLYARRPIFDPVVEEVVPQEPLASSAKPIAMRQIARSSGLSRMRLLFKKSSRSDDEEGPEEDEEFDSARSSSPSSSGEEGKGQSTDDEGETEGDRERLVRINLAGDNIEGKSVPEYPSLYKIKRTVSTTSSMVVETGDAPPPQREQTPPPFYQLPFLRRSYNNGHGQANGGDQNKHSVPQTVSNGLKRNSSKPDLAAMASSSVSSKSSNAAPTSKLSSKDTNSTSSPEQQVMNETENLAAPHNHLSGQKSISPSAVGNRGLSGLVNLGNTCFMNAILQALSHTPPLVERMLNDVKPVDPPNVPQPPSRPSLVRSDRLARVFSSLLRDQWKVNPEKYRRPDELKTIIASIAPQFQGHRQQDAQELLVCLLDGLHDCLNRIRRRPTYVEMDPPKSLSDEELSYMYWDNYERANDSFIKDLFCGQLMSKVTCQDCQSKSTSFDVFWDLSLPVPSQEKSLNLTDLLKMFCDIEKMGDDCGFKCEACARTPLAGATKQFSIAMRPKVLVLHLKRFSHEKTGTRKIITPVAFPLKDLKMGSDLYDLAAVVNHIGSFASGHYTADVYNPITKSWFHADDGNLTPTTRVGINAYLLFYVESSKNDRAVRSLLKF